MVRLADLPEWDRKNKLDKLKELTGWEARPWVKPPPLSNCRVAIVTTAGVHRKGDRPFGPGATDYRIIPGDCIPQLFISRHLQGSPWPIKQQWAPPNHDAVR